MKKLLCFILILGFLIGLSVLTEAAKVDKIVKSEPVKKTTPTVKTTKVTAPKQIPTLINPKTAQAKVTAPKDSKKKNTTTVITNALTPIDPFIYLKTAYHIFGVYNSSNWPNETLGGADGLPDGSGFAALWTDGTLVFYSEDTMRHLQTYNLKEQGDKSFQTMGRTGVTFVPSKYPGPVAVCDETGIDFYDWDGDWKARWVINAQVIIDMEYDAENDHIILATKYEGMKILNTSNFQLTPFYDPYRGLYSRDLEGIEYVDMENNPPTYNLIQYRKYSKRVSLDGHTVDVTQRFDSNLGTGYTSSNAVLYGIAYTRNFIVAIGTGGFYFYDDHLLQDHMQWESYLPDIRLMQPENNYTINMTGPIVFTYNVSGGKELANCSLLINGTESQVSTSPLRYTIQNFTAELPNGDYDWQVKCYDISGGYGISGSRLLSIKINHAPVLEPVAGKVVMPYETVMIQLNATDIDNDNLTYGIVANISGYTFDNMTGLFFWAPESIDSGQHNITFNVTDGLLYDSINVSITVLGNTAPVLEPLEDITVFDNTLIQIQLNASDAEDDLLIFGTDAFEKITGAFDFDSATGLFTWQPMPYESGTYVILFNVTDGMLTDTKNVTITVNITPNCTNIIYHPEVNPSQATMEERIKFCLDTGFWQSMNMGQLKYAGIIYENNNFQWYGNCRDMTSDAWNTFPKYEIDLSACGMQPVIPECFDSDGGKNYSVSGRTGKTADGPFYDQDYCQQGGDIDNPSMQYLVNSCNGTDCYLIENFCNLGYNKHEALNCPNGCNSGACV